MITANAHEIMTALAQRVVGQDQAIRTLSTLFGMHLHWFATPDVEHTAPNALLIGPTGVGKTHAVRTAAESFQIPLVVVDAASLNLRGQGGTSFEDVLFQLIARARQTIRSGVLQRSFGDSDELDEVSFAMRGVVVIDEFDKLTVARDFNSHNLLLQRKLLEFVDGATVTLDSGSTLGGREIHFDTAGLLFVAAGTFSDLDSSVSQRSHVTMRSLQHPEGIIAEDFVRYGFLPELVARFPVLVQFAPLTSSSLELILQTPAVSPVVFYDRYLASLGTTLVISDSVMARLASMAERLGMGVRGLHQTLFPLMALLCRDIEDNPRSHYRIDDADLQQLLKRTRGGE